MANTDQEAVNRMSKILGALISNDVPLGGATPEGLVLLAGTLMTIRRKADSNAALQTIAFNMREVIPIMVEAVNGLDLVVAGPPAEVPIAVRKFVAEMISDHTTNEHGSELDDRIREIAAEEVTDHENSHHSDDDEESDDAATT